MERLASTAYYCAGLATDWPVLFVQHILAIVLQCEECEECDIVQNYQPPLQVHDTSQHYTLLLPHLMIIAAWPQQFLIFWPSNLSNYYHWADKEKMQPLYLPCPFLLIGPDVLATLFTP